MMRAAALLLVFLLGVLGHLLTAEQKQSTSPLFLTLCAEGVDNALADGLSTEELTACTSWYAEGCAATLLSFDRRASLAEGYADGRYLRYPSSLRSDLYFTLLVDGHLREENIYLDTVYLAVGKECTLSSPRLHLRTRVTELSFG